ncbi:MAG: peptidylprolyl isomerase [Armatimonadota bacterium]
MLNKRLIATTALVVAVAIPSTVWAAEQSKPAVKKAPVVKTAPAKTTPAPAKPAAAKPATQAVKPAATAIKPTMEANLKKFKSGPDSAVVATVGNENITKGELMDALWDWYAPQALEECINSKMILQALKKDGVSVTQSDIDARLTEVASSNVRPGDTLDATLQRSKATRARINSTITVQLALEKILEKQTQLTDAEYSEFIKARHILIRPATTSPDATLEEKTKADTAAKETAEKILAEIKGGKSFEQAAKEYSDDPSNKENGGELGWFRRNEMVQQFSDAAFNLKAGEISEPVKTQFGYHLVKVDKLGKNATPAEKDSIRKRILAQRMQMELGKVFNSIKSDAKINNILVPTLPDPKPAEMSDEQTVPPTKIAPKTQSKPAPAPQPAK